MTTHLLTFKLTSIYAHRNQCLTSSSCLKIIQWVLPTSIYCNFTVNSKIKFNSDSLLMCNYYIIKVHEQLGKV